VESAEIFMSKSWAFLSNLTAKSHRWVCNDN
jgi:hypothetical protein